MDEVQLAVIVTRIQVIVLWGAVTKNHPNWITAVCWVKISSSWWWGVDIFNLDHLSDPAQVQWVQCVGGSDALNEGMEEEAVSHVTAQAGILFLILWKLVETPWKR